MSEPEIIDLLPEHAQEVANLHITSIIGRDYQVARAKKVATLNLGGAATANVCFVIGK